MRLYSLIDATEHHDPECGRFTPGPDGGFDFPDDLSDKLIRQHVGRRPMWETEIGRQVRLMDAELERRRDPASLLKAVESAMAVLTAIGASGAEATADEVAKRGPGRPRRSAV